MFDEPGSNYQPQPAPAPKPTETPPQVEPVRQGRVILIPASRPLWVRVLGFYLGFLTISRLFSLSGKNPASIVVQLLTVGVLIVTTLGILGMRRWGAWFFLLYAGWTIANSLAVGTARLMVVNDVIDNVATQQMVMASEILLMALTVTFNGGVALWVALHLKRFIPMNGLGQHGAAPFIVILAILLLMSASQIQSARKDVADQAKAVENTTFSLPKFLR